MPTGEERRGAVCGKIACTVRCRRREETEASRLDRAARRLPPTLPRPDHCGALLRFVRSNSQTSRASAVMLSDLDAEAESWRQLGRRPLAHSGVPTV
jgi:hypothetical protein